MDVRKSEPGTDTSEAPKDPRKRFTLCLLAELSADGEPNLETAELEYRNRVIFGAGEAVTYQVTEVVAERYNETRPLTKADRERFNLPRPPGNPEAT